ADLVAFAHQYFFHRAPFQMLYGLAVACGMHRCIGRDAGVQRRCGRPIDKTAETEQQHRDAPSQSRPGVGIDVGHRLIQHECNLIVIFVHSWLRNCVHAMGAAMLYALETTCRPPCALLCAAAAAATCSCCCRSDLSTSSRGPCISTAPSRNTSSVSTLDNMFMRCVMIATAVPRRFRSPTV